MDLLQREGHYPVPPQAGPILGVEFSGTIESLGEGYKDGFKKGDEVFGLAYGGAYAEFIAVSTHMLLHKPAHLSWEQAAGVPEVKQPSIFSKGNCFDDVVDLDYGDSSYVPGWRI
jgi:NADPH:quinone reductase-like Zn-dependent oxidoreductase